MRSGEPRFGRTSWRSIVTVEGALAVADGVFPDEAPLEPRKLALLRAVVDDQRPSATDESVVDG